jgi:peptidoglycan-associated lipoprotein
MELVPMSTFSASTKLAALSVLLLLTACATKTEAPASTSGTSEVITPGSMRDFQVNVGDRVFFDFDSSVLRDDGKATLQKQAAWLAKYPSVRLTVEGHCDERGTREYNLALGARRADTTKEYLVSLGVAASRMDTISYGKEKPVCVESNEGCWAQNRRAVSVISGGVSS